MAAETVSADKQKRRKFGKKTDSDGEEKKAFVPRSAQELQKLHLERLMKEPDKLIEIPERKREWKPRTPSDFVRHVMGSSAGAGSGEFHVYRGIRRRENARTNYIEENAAVMEADEAYDQKLEGNRLKDEEKTAKKRAKRQKKKQKKLQAKKQKKETDEDKGNQSASDDTKEDSDGDELEEPHFLIGGR